MNDPILMDLNQPEDCTVFNQTVVICTVPPQKWEVIQAINRLNYELRICAFRPSDNRMSMNAFKFEYLPHVPTEQNAQSFQSFQSSSGWYFKLILGYLQSGYFFCSVYSLVILELYIYFR